MIQKLFNCFLDAGRKFLVFSLDPWFSKWAPGTPRYPWRKVMMGSAVFSFYCSGGNHT